MNLTLVPYESNIEDSSMVSSDAVYVAAPAIHDVSVETLQFGWNQPFTTVYLIPVLDAEMTSFRVVVKNKGTEPETEIEVKLYSNSTLLKTWTSSLLPGATAELKWQQLLVACAYNITVQAIVEADFDPSNNIQAGTLQVIDTPQLNISYTPEWVLSNQTVFLDASASYHRQPDASIVEYRWEFWIVGETAARTIFKGSDLVNITYQLTEDGEWRVILLVKDNYNIEYDRFRPATSDYRIQVTIDVKEGSTNSLEAGTWNSITYYVNITSNSTVTDFYFNPDAGPFIKFNVTGSIGTGVCQIAIPQSLLWVENGEWQVLVDGESIDCTIIEDENTTYVCFIYDHSTRSVQIMGTDAIPEFRQTIILLLFAVLATLTIILVKKRPLRKQRA